MPSYSDRDIESFLATGEHEDKLRLQFGDGLYDELRRMATAVDSERAALEAAGRPVFILPGIMGSKLSRPGPLVFTDEIWIDLDDLAAGGVRKLEFGQNPDPVFASGAVLAAYLRMKLALNLAGFNADFLPYDWRYPVAEAGARLHKKLTQDGVRDAVLVAHSMGGLVARQIAALDPGRSVAAKVITVGTPNFGSYSPVQVFRLTHSLLITLGKWDLVHTPGEIANKYLRHFPGLIEMMPSPEKRPDEKYFESQYWPSGGARPLKPALEAAGTAQDTLPAPDDRFVQIVGTGEETIQQARIENDEFVYETSTDGDGTVPRDLAEMGDVTRFYATGKHGQLCNQRPVINAVKDIIRTGSTSALPSIPPASALERAAVPRIRTDTEWRQTAETRLDDAGPDLTQEDILNAFASAQFDPDPTETLSRGAEAGPAGPAGPRGRARPALPRAEQGFLAASETAARNWRRARPDRERGEQLIEAGRALEAEQPARIERYARRLVEQLKALPIDAERRMPSELREAVREIDRRTRPEAMEAMPPAVSLERIINGAEEFLSVMFIKRAALVLKSVGRIVTRHGHSGFGTGFMVAPNVLMTNWHVLRTEAEAADSAVQFDFELDAGSRDLNDEVFTFQPDRLYLADRTLDFALVAVSPTGLEGGRLSRFGHLPLVGAEGKIRVGNPVNIIQHPAGKRKQVVFRDSTLEPLPTNPDTVAHYTGDTKQGSSGSPVFSDRWEVVALHHAGVPATDNQGNWLDVNGRVWQRAGDPNADNVKWIANEGIRISRIVRRLEAAHDRMEPGSPQHRHLGDVLEVGRRAEQQGVFYVAPNGEESRPQPVRLREETTIAEEPRPGGGGTQSSSGPRPPEGTGPVAGPVAAAGAVSFPVPLRVTFSLDGDADAGAAAPTMPGTDPEIEDAFERRRPSDYDDRRGYDPDFLGAHVPMPRPMNTIRDDVATLRGSRETELKYDHFSVLMSRRRRLAYVSAGNFRPDAPFTADRRNPWGLDPRLDRDLQADNRFYKNNDLDRGHLFRRADGAWGETAAEARRASDDTFHWTNIAPQHFVFNQSGQDPNRSLWGLLENHLVDEAEDERKRLSVFNGPVFQVGDPLHRGLAVPQAFWKVAVIRHRREGLKAFAFVVGQESLLADLPRERFDAGRFDVHQVRIRDLEVRTGLDFGSLRDADVLERTGAEARFEAGRTSVPLAGVTDIVGARNWAF